MPRGSRQSAGPQQEVSAGHHTVADRQLNVCTRAHHEGFPFETNKRLSFVIVSRGEMTRRRLAGTQLCPP